MALEHLDSIFTENLSALAEDYQANQALNTGDTMMVPNISLPTETPILDEFSRLPSSFIGVPSSFGYTPASDLPAFRMQTFDPRIPKNNRIQINTKNTYAGTVHTPELVTDYSTAGMFDNAYTPQSEKENTAIGGETYSTSNNDLGGLGLDLRASKGWFSLYNSDHTPRDIDFKFEKHFGSYNYGGNVSREGLNIRNPRADGIFTGLAKNFRNPGVGLGESEPYIVSEIGLGGRLKNSGNRSIPIGRAITDESRISKFLSSPAGITFAIKQNISQVIPGPVVRASTGVDLLGAWSLTGPFSDFANYHGHSLRMTPQRFNRGYNPLSTLAAISPAARALGIGSPIILNNSGGASIFETAVGSGYSVSDEYGKVNDPYYGLNTVPFLYEDSIRGGTSARTGNRIGLIQFASRIIGAVTRNPLLNNVSTPYSDGDKFTMADKISGYQLRAKNWQTKPVDIDGKDSGFGSTNFNIEGEKQGMPLYFKDLRTDQYLFFRAYVSGLTENITPNWTPSNYIGRSEPVYVYERGERDVSFILKLFAHTKHELTKIYDKLNHLTSLCYPQYMHDVGMNHGYGSGAYKQYRMKPPLVKFRLGELYGDINKEQLTFIKSLTYTVPDEGIWEVRAGARVPKYITAAVSLQILHESNQEDQLVPGYGTKFFGYTGKFTPHTEKWARNAQDIVTGLEYTPGIPTPTARLVRRDTEDY
mgnify:FL=1